MKKLSIFLCALFCAATSMMAISPDDIAGKWESKWVNTPSPDREISSKEKSSYVFNQDGTFTSKNEMQLSILGQTAVDCFFYADLKGTYTAAGDSISIHVDPSSIRLDFPEDEIRISGQVDPDQESMIKSTFHYNMRSMLPEIKKAIKDFTITDVVITEDKKHKKMTCSDAGTKMEFTQKKKK